MIGLVMLVMIGSLFPLSAACAQERVRILGNPQYVIQVDTSGPVLHATEDIFPAAVMARRGDGLTLLRTFDPYRVLFLDAQGKILADLNSRGEGPGELRNVLDAGFFGDTVWVAEPGGMVHLFALDGAFLGRYPLPIAPKGLTDTPDGGFVINGFGTNPDWDGTVVHIYSGDRFSSVPRPRGDPFAVSRIESWARTLTASRSGSIAAGHVYRYRVDIIGLNGEVERILEREGVMESGDPLSERRPHEPQLMHVRFDEDQRLWISYTILQTAPRSTGGSERWDVLDACVDVVNPEDGHLLASGCYDRPVFFGIMEDGSSTVRLPDGESLSVVKPHLVERSP